MPKSVVLSEHEFRIEADKRTKIVICHHKQSYDQLIVKVRGSYSRHFMLDDVRCHFYGECKGNKANCIMQLPPGFSPCEHTVLEKKRRNAMKRPFRAAKRMPKPKKRARRKTKRFSLI